MVQTLMLIVRKAMRLEQYVTIKHIEYMNIVSIVTGSIVGVAYLTELFISYYSGVEYESYAFINRFSGPYAWAYWSMMTCNVVSPHLFWFKKLRTSLGFTFFMSIIVRHRADGESKLFLTPGETRTLGDFLYDTKNLWA